MGTPDPAFAVHLPTLRQFGAFGVGVGDCKLMFLEIGILKPITLVGNLFLRDLPEEENYLENELAGSGHSVCGKQQR